MSDADSGRIGSSFGDFLDEESVRKEIEAQALKEVLAWRIEQEMKAVGLTKPRQRAACPPGAPSLTVCSIPRTPR